MRTNTSKMVIKKKKKKKRGYVDTRKKFKQCHPHDKLTQWIEPPPDRLLRLSLALSRWRRDCVATRPACDAILSARISVRRVWTHAKEGKKKERKKKKKKDEHRGWKRSTGKIYARRRRHVEDCRRSSDRKRPRAHFLRFAHVHRLFSSRGRPLPPSGRPRRHGLIENSIILFLSTGWRVLPRIDSRIYNATWVSELTASTGCAHTELAYWTAFWGPARKRAGSPRPLESV